MKTCPNCGSQYFDAVVVQYYSGVVSGDGDIVDSNWCIDAEIGPCTWTCCECEAEYPNGEGLKEV